MTKSLNNISSKYYGFISALFAMLGMYLILSYHQCIGGDLTILCGDLLEQYIPYIKMLCRDLLNGESIWFSWSSFMGMNTSLLNAYYAMSPFNIFYLIFWNADESIITAVIIILKNGFAAYTFHIFIKRVLNCHGAQSIMFASMYALSMYIVNYGFMYNSWMDGMIWLPLICTYIYELDCDRKNYLKLTFSYAILFVSQFYIGYMVGVFSFLFWLVLLLTKEKKTFTDVMKKTAKYAASVILAICMVAIVLLPALLFLIANNQGNASGFLDLKVTIFEWLYSLFWGSSVPRINSYPALYCGWPVLILLPLFFFNKEIELKEKVRYGILGIFLILTTVIEPLFQMMHAFDAPNFHNHRHAFLIVFLFCALAAKQSMYIYSIKVRKLFLVTAICATVYPIVAWFADTEHNDYILKVVVNIILALVWFGIWFAIVKKKINAQSLAVVSIVFIIIELFANGWYIIDTSENEPSDAYKVWKKGIADAVSEIESDDEFFRMYYNIDMVSNSDSWFGYNGVSDFSSGENYDLRQSMTGLGLYSTPRVLAPRGAGMTNPVEMLLGVKYVVTGPNPYLELSEDNYYTIVENPYCLNLGYMVEDEVLAFRCESTNSFENVNSLLQTMSGETVKCFEPYAGQIVILCENAEVVMNSTQTAIKYDSDLYENAMVTYSVAKENVDGPIYVLFPGGDSIMYDDAPYMPGGYENIFQKYGALTVPYIKPLLIGENEYAIAVVMNEKTVDEYSFENPVFYTYKEAALAEVHATLSQGQMNVKTYEDGYVSANVNVSEDKTVLFTSIPYDEGWTVFVDGVEYEAIAVVDEAFLALKLEPGYHELEFKYEAPGVKEGMGISALSIVIYILLIVIAHSKSRKEKDVSTEREV